MLYTYKKFIHQYKNSNYDKLRNVINLVALLFFCDIVPFSLMSCR